MPSRGTELWVCPNCGNEGDIHFDRSLCVCGMMHHYCGCGVQADDCDPDGENPYLVLGGTLSDSPADAMSNRGSTPVNLEGVRMSMAKHRHECAEAFAIAMHEHVAGSWEASGHDVKEGFRAAGLAAYDALAAQGWDLFALPEGGWGLVT